MHTSLLHHLVKTINTKMKIIREQVQLIQFLLKIIFRSNLLDQIQSKSPSLKQPTDLNFQKFRVDELPIIEETEKLDFRILLAEYKAKHSKDLNLFNVEMVNKFLPTSAVLNVMLHMRFFTTIMGVRDSSLVKSAKRIFISKIDSLKS